MLIQDENNKWKYYSVNGDNSYSSGSHSGGRKFDDLGVGEFNSVNDFLNSPYNQETSESKDDKNFTHYDYETAYFIPTTEDQDKIIKEEFIRISTTEEFTIKLIKPNHCGTTVQRSLHKAGINNFEDIETPSNGTFPGRRIKIMPYFPNDIYNTIKNNNPHGKEYKK